MGGSDSKLQEEANDKLDDLIKIVRKQHTASERRDAIISVHKKQTLNHYSQDREITQNSNGYALISVNSAQLATGIGIGSVIILLIVGGTKRRNEGTTSCSRS